MVFATIIATPVSTNLTRRFTIATLHEGREERLYPVLFKYVLSDEKTRAMRVADITIEPDDILEQVAVTHNGVPTGRTVSSYCWYCVTN